MITCAYDTMGFLTEIKKDGTLHQHIKRNYRGQVTTVTDAAGNSRHYEYGRTGKLLSHTDEQGNQTAYTYDAIGRPVQTLSGEGIKTTYTYGRGGAITAVTKDGMPPVLLTEEKEPSPHSSARHILRDEEGRPTRLTYPGGIEQQRSYTHDGLLKDIRLLRGTIPIASRSYTYDKRGNNTALTIKDTLKPEQDGTWEYRYDTRNRLTEILFDGKQTVRYTYDPYGNRTLKEENGKTTAYTYDKADRLTEKKEDSDTYTYTYDKKGSLTAITKNGQFHEAYTYDANGNRIRKEEKHQTTTYRYDPLNHRIKKTVLIKHPHQNETTSETTYRHDPTAPIHTLREITKDKKTTAVTFTENGDLETTTKDGTTRTYITDQNGTPLYTITEDGNLISLPSRGPFGERQEKNKTKTPAHPHTEEETTFPISYAGYEEEPDGTYLAGCRYYDPELGRFLSRDRLGGLA